MSFIGKKIGELSLFFRSDKLFLLVTIWLGAYFLCPTRKMHYMLFLVIFLPAITWLLYSNKINWGSLIKSRVFIVSSLYILLYAISLTWSNHDDFSGKFRDFKSVVYLYVFWVVSLYVLKENYERLEIMFKVFFYVGIFSVFMNALIFYGLDGNTIYRRFEGIGRLYNALGIAAIYASLALISLVYLFNSIGSQSKQKIAGLVLAYAIFAIATVLTHSRTPIAGLLLMSLFVVATSSQRIKTKLLILTTLVAGMAASAYSLRNVFREAIERGESYRLELWYGFIDRARERLMFGHGGGSEVNINVPGSIVDGSPYYHSAYIGSLVDLGIVGLSLHIAIIAIFAHLCLRFWKHNIVKAAFVVFMFNCIASITVTQGIVTRMNLQWLMFWMPVIIVSMYELKEKGVSLSRRTNIAS
ncbi:O-antigen ligase family protein [Methylophaga lonarensis]|uniref:O-antigen ligase family protein n=1 Tax=Methylophaga lonarensis TaxID=999151 RepID=UPI003D2E3B4D